MASENRLEVEELQAEVRILREKVAYLEGRRRGTFTTLEIVLPVTVAVFALLGFTALTSRVNALVDQRVEAIVAREVESLVSPEMVEGRLDDAIEEVIVRTQQAVLEAQQAVIMAEAAAAEAGDSATEAEDAAGEAENAVDMVEAVATQASVEAP